MSARTIAITAETLLEHVLAMVPFSFPKDISTVVNQLCLVRLKEGSGEDPHSPGKTQRGKAKGPERRQTRAIESRYSIAIYQKASAQIESFDPSYTSASMKKQPARNSHA
jgi:hypothetical protein